MMRPVFIFMIVTGLFTAWSPSSSGASDKELNLYSSRHYTSDDRYIADFMQKTGIYVNLVEGRDSALLNRLKQEGANSPADVFISVDVGTLQEAAVAGLLTPLPEPPEGSAIPAHLRHDGGLWQGVSLRARIIFYAKGRVPEGAIKHYADLSGPQWKGRLCLRGCASKYNRAMISSWIDQWGIDETRRILEGYVANMARPPKGGDTDQIHGLLNGECDVTLANHYYYLRLLDGQDSKRVGDGVGIVFPDQPEDGGSGAHMNATVIGMLANAPHKENALRFIRFLETAQTQAAFIAGVGEFPVTPGVDIPPKARNMGTFVGATQDIAALGRHQKEALALCRQTGWD